MSTTCPFCRPGIQEAVFTSSGDFLAIYNKSPILPGHSLVIPRRHVPNLLSLSGAELTAFFLFAREVTEGLLQFFGTNAFNWSIQEQAVAGQTVNHLHLHIVPRQEHDLPEPGDWYPILIKSYDNHLIDSQARPRLSDEQVAEMTLRLKNDWGKKGQL